MKGAGFSISGWRYSSIAIKFSLYVACRSAMNIRNDLPHQPSIHSLIQGISAVNLP